MPELPEVETVRRSLEPFVPGRRIARVEIRDSLVIKRPDPSHYPKLLEGQQFTHLDRLGKYLILHLERHGLLVHLGMTGQLTFRDPTRPDTAFLRHPYTGLQRTLQHPVDAHTHISLEFEDGTALHYRDIRKFGKWRLYPTEDLERSPELTGLGPDPITGDFRLEPFQARLRKTSRAVKAALLDQAVVAGLGNIYVDEALFRAGVRPRKAARRLTGRETERLHSAIKEVLLAGIEAGGTTLRDFVDGTGAAGTNQERLLVYGRHGQPCAVCGTPLKRATVAQRTTSWCAVCQR